MSYLIETGQSREHWETLGLPKDTEVLTPVGVELFTARRVGQTNLPERIATNPVLLEQAEQRRVLYLDLRKAFDRIEDVNQDFDAAALPTEEAIYLYKSLTNFLATDENNARIILYLPSQLLPNIQNAENSLDPLMLEKQHFANEYKRAWVRILHESDARASFVDGDILEPGMGQPERIRKAAHLIPDALAKGILSIKEVLEQLELASDDELLRSLTEGIIVANDRQLIDATSWKIIETLAAGKKAISEVMEKPNVQDNNAEYLGGNLVGTVTERAANTLETELNNVETSTGVSPERVKWEKQIQRDKAIGNAALMLANGIKNGTITTDDLTNFSAREGLEDAYRIACIKSLVMLPEETDADKAKIQAVVNDNQEFLKASWENGSTEVKDTAISTISHLRKLDIVSEEFVRGLGIKIPDLALPFDVDMNQFVGKEHRYLVEAANKIKENPVLTEYFFPVFLNFGSRLKGYASLNADIDIALFVKPNTPWEKREEVLELLRREVPELQGVEKILEYWVDEKEGRYSFRSPNTSIPTIVGAQQVHFFMGGVWISNGPDARKLYGDIVARYLDLHRFDRKEMVRASLLRQVESDVLQYRLMHKGYRRYYPDRRPEKTIHSYLIDGQSDYWDPGYRRVATELFLSRVFLPDLSEDKK